MLVFVVAEREVGRVVLSVVNEARFVNTDGLVKQPYTASCVRRRRR